MQLHRHREEFEEAGARLAVIGQGTPRHAEHFIEEYGLDGMQVLGGYGYLREYDMQRFVRDSLLGPIGGGTNQIQRLIIGKNL